ncbi:MAG: glycosyltransferase [Gammaproteobacteria bacterium]
MMKTTFITTHYPPSTGFGGVCEASYGLSNALARNGIHIDVVTSDAQKGSRIPFGEFTKMDKSKLSIHPFKYFFDERSCFSFGAKRLIKDLVHKSDLVHVNGIYTHPASLGARCARQVGKPHIVAIRNGLDPWMMKIKRTKKLLGFFLYVRADLNRATCIHVTAKQEIDACMSMGVNKPFTIIPNGINALEFSNLPDPEHAEETWQILKRRKVVLFLGRLSKQKGLDMLISVWERIIKKHADAILVIAGPDYLRYGNYVRSLAHKKSYRDTIIFIGNVAGQSKLALYSRADVFVLPSYSENFGNVVAEALVCGTPVVTTQATPWSEIERHRCGLWVPVDENAIGEAIDDLLSLSDKERSGMGRRGKEFIASKYTWDISARKMITVYHAMINGDKIPLYPEPYTK